MKHTMLAKRLRQLIQERDISVSELARRAGVVDNTIRQLTLGNSEVPTFRVGLALAKALGIHPEELLYVPEEEPKETLVDRVDKLEAAVAHQGSQPTTKTPIDSQVDSPVDSPVNSLIENRIEKLEAVILRMLQSQGLHQKELEEIRKVMSPAEIQPVETRRVGKQPLQASRATRRV